MRNTTIAGVVVACVLVIVLAAVLGNRDRYDQPRAAPDAAPAVEVARTEPAVAPAEVRPPTSEEIAEQAEQARVVALREPIADEVRKLLRARNVEATVAVNSNTLEVASEACNARLLVSLRDKLTSRKHDPRATFGNFNCGEFGDVIDLTTKDGCDPNQHDILVLTDGADDRDKFARAIGRYVGDMWNGFLVVSNGCDGTTLEITLLSGFDSSCDAEKLENLKAKSGAVLRRHGFRKLLCGPDGAELELR